MARAGADLSPTVAIVHAAGGTEVSVFLGDGSARAEFSVEVANRAEAVRAANRVLVALTTAMPLLVGGWILGSINAM